MSTIASLKSVSTSPLPLWTEEEKQKLKWEHIPQNMSIGRYGSAATSIGNQFLLFGGCGKNDKKMSNSDVLDVDTQTWSALPSIPTARYFCAAVVVDNCAIVIGGSNGIYLATVEMIDLETKKWTTLPSMSSPRNGCVAVVVGNHVIVMGGYNGSSYLKTVEMYNIDSREWTNLPPMSSARRLFGAAVVDEKVYVFGGQGGADRVSEVYNTRTQEWTVLPSLPFSHRYGVAVAIGKQIVLMGGQYDGKRSEKVNMFDTESHEWTSLPPVTTKRYFCAASLVQNQLIAAAGQDEKSRCLNTVERMVVPMSWLSSLPAPPEIPPAPSVLGRLQRKSALQQWVERTIAIKKEYLDKVEEKRQIITEAVKTKKEEMDEQFRDFEEAIKAKKEELNEQFCEFEERSGKFLKELEDAKDGWVELVDNQIEDAKDQLGHLTSRLNPPSPKSDKSTHSYGRTLTKKGKDPPSHLLCPITGKLMNDPVVAADGQTYERVAIEHHISKVPEGQDVHSPITGVVLVNRIVHPNVSIRNLVRSYQG